jgi:pimeloyl-ACP methyl ester carboxylesterase
MRAYCFIFLFLFSFLGATPPTKVQPVSFEGLILVNGCMQFISAHGASSAAPVLLVLHGGPGLAYSGFCRQYQAGLEESFIVVNWDQRGCGKSWQPGFDPEELSIGLLVADLHDLTNLLKEKYQKDKIFLLGHSWGTRLGLLAAQKYPMDYLAFFGAGQVTGEQDENEALFDKVLETAREKADEESVKILLENGKSDVNQDWLNGYLRMKLAQYGFVDRDFDIAKTVEASYSGTTENVKDQSQRYWARVNQVYKKLSKEIQTMESFFTLIPEIKIPVIFLEGRYDFIASSELAARYLDVLKAPYKKIYWFEHSAHWMLFQESKKFNQTVIDEAKKF